MPVAGPFYLAYVADDTVAFDPVTHARMDEYVFSWRRVLSETDKPVLDLEMKNPHIGLLNPSRNQWAWLSWLNPANNHVEPLFLGRIAANPSNVLSEVINVQFVSWPTDFFKQRQTVAETLKVPPFWDEVFIATDKIDNPDSILEARSELWCVDPITLQVTAEDIIDGSDGNVDITSDNHFYDALDIHDGDAPLTAVLMDATVSWTQTGRGFINMGDNIISSYAGDGILGEWPKGLASLGSGWSVYDAFAADYGHTEQITTASISYTWNNPDKEHADGDTLSISFSQTSPGGSETSTQTGSAPGATAGMLATTLLVREDIGLLDPSAVDGDGDPAPINRPASFNGTYAYVPPWRIYTHLVLRYDLARQRTERVRIMLTADLQAIINDPLVTQNSETITMTGRDVGVPIVKLLDWTTIANTDVLVDQVVFPDNPTLPGSTTAQICVVAGHTGTEEPQFSDVPGTITVDGTAHWASLGTSNPTEGAQDWTGFTNYNPGAIILPQKPLSTPLADFLLSGQLQFPPVGTQVALGQVFNDSLVCTFDGILGLPSGNTAVLTPLPGGIVPDGKTYYMTPNGGRSGALYVTPAFGSHTALHSQVSDNGITWVSIGPGDIPAGGTAGNVWARSYFSSTRGRRSLEYLMAIQRAHIRKRARAVEIEFECDFELGVGITCRKTVTLHDPRIPGGLALGKVTRSELSADGDTGVVKCHVTIGCAVGRGNAVTTVPGTGVYAAPGYMQSGYQKEVGGIVVLPDLTDVGYTPPIDTPNDDGLVLPLDKRQVTITEGIKGDISLQVSAVKRAFNSMAKAAQLPYSLGFFPVRTVQNQIDLQNAQALLQADSVGRELQGQAIYYEAQLKPVTNGPFFDAYVISTQLMTVPMGIDLRAASTP